MTGMNPGLATETFSPAPAPSILTEWKLRSPQDR